MKLKVGFGKISLMASPRCLIVLILGVVISWANESRGEYYFVSPPNLPHGSLAEKNAANKVARILFRKKPIDLKSPYWIIDSDSRLIKGVLRAGSLKDASGVEGVEGPVGAYIEGLLDLEKSADWVSFELFKDIRSCTNEKLEPHQIGKISLSISDGIETNLKKKIELAPRDEISKINEVTFATSPLDPSYLVLAGRAATDELQAYDGYFFPSARTVPVKSPSAIKGVISMEAIVKKGNKYDLILNLGGGASGGIVWDEYENEKAGQRHILYQWSD